VAASVQIIDTPFLLLDGYMEVDAEGSVVRMNRRALEIYGGAAEDVARALRAPPEEQQRLWVELAAERAADPRTFRAALHRHRSLAPEVIFDLVPLRDGRILERCSVPVRDAAGRVTGRAAYLRDVSARRGDEEDLRERARRSAAVADLGELALFAEDLDALARLAVRVVAGTLGADLAHFLELSPADRVLRLRHVNVPEGTIGVEPISADAGSMSGYTLQCDSSVVSSDLDAERRFTAPRLRAIGVRSGISAIVRGRERPHGILAVFWRRPHSFAPEEIRFVETTANVVAAALVRAETEQRLLEREREARAVFENTLDALVTLDDGGRLVDANQTACQLLGRPLQALRGLDLAGLFGASGQRLRVEWSKLVEGARFAGELEVAAGGGPRIVEYSAVSRILPSRHLLVMHDVTADRQMRSRLALADRLAAARALAAGVAHELNNPLSYVVANLTFVAESLQRLARVADEAGPTGELADAVREAREGAERMRAIIRDLKTFSRAAESRTGPVDLRGVLESCVSIAWNEIRHRARFVRDLADVPPVRGDEGRLGQVFLNLLVNAAQAIGEGQADRNEIRLSTRLRADGRIAVELRDTGCGISQENLSRIFDPFFTTKPVGEGTGLGLTICHNIVTALGGAIEVESLPGCGSVFRVVLPPEEAVRPAPAPLRLTPVPGVAGRRGRVLVVDDEPLVGAAVRRALGTDHDVTVVPGGREALRRLERERFDVVVSDLLMPEVTGMELHAAVEARDPALAERMIFVTGGAFTPAARRFVEEHRERVLEKPFELAALRELVRLGMVPTA
jgi:PAS domain S-box-containing protein